MKNAFLACVLIFPLLFSGCVFAGTTVEIRVNETRTGLMGTNLIGIVGEPSAEPYIEIRYSMADETRPGYNITVSRMVSPPYIFKNNRVIISYLYREERVQGRWVYRKQLIRDFEEGGSEYFRIINHSPDKTVEFFLAGTQTETLSGYISLPSIRYRRAPIYFLLFPERKHTTNILWSNGDVFYFEGDRIGDLAVTQAWSIDDIIDLYRAEFAHSDDIQLTIDDEYNRMIDLVSGTAKYNRRFQDKIFYGFVEPGEELRENENIWLLATPLMFDDSLDSGPLP